MEQKPPHFLEYELAKQLQSLHKRLEATVARRKLLETRVQRLRTQLHTEELRLAQEKERENALLTAVRMAKLACSLASGDQLEQHEMRLLLYHDYASDTDWDAMTIAEACRYTLRANFNRSMSNKELREALLLKGKDVSLGSIATTLERYRDMFAKNKEGNVSYWYLAEDATEDSLTSDAESRAE